jgi:serine/threonine protein phosphatase PrpC
LVRKHQDDIQEISMAMLRSQIPAPPLLIGMHTDPGRSGKNNEDALDTFVVEWQENTTKIHQVYVAVVADGIGGHNAGERASRIAVERIRQVMTKERIMPIPQRLETALLAANQDIFTASQYDNSLRGMGTTVVAAAIVNSTLYVVHAGDSRAYLIRNGTIYPLTIDHTWAQEAIEAGRLTPEMARLHPNRHVIKRFLGIDKKIDIDHTIIDIKALSKNFDPYAIHSKTDHLTLLPGDRILLCSDGLNDELTDEEILSVAQKGLPQKASEQLVAMANAKGGRDNISVILLELPRSQSPIADFNKVYLIIALAALVVAISGGIGIGYILRRPEMQVPVAMLPSPASTATASPSTPTLISPAGSMTTLKTPGAADTSTQPPPVPDNERPSPDIPPTSTPVSIPNRLSPSPSPTIPAGNGRETNRSTPTPTVEAQAFDLWLRLVSPNPGDSGSGILTFQWEYAAGSLPPGYGIELLFWPRNGDPIKDGIALWPSPVTGNITKITVDLTSLLPGEYQWGSVLVQLSPYKRLRLVSESRLFYRVEQPSIAPPRATTPTPTQPTPTPTQPTPTPTPTPTQPTPTPTPTQPTPTPTPTQPTPTPTPTQPTPTQPTPTQPTQPTPTPTPEPPTPTPTPTQPA